MRVSESERIDLQHAKQRRTAVLKLSRDGDKIRVYGTAWRDRRRNRQIGRIGPTGHARRASPSRVAIERQIAGDILAAGVEGSYRSAARPVACCIANADLDLMPLPKDITEFQNAYRKDRDNWYNDQSFSQQHALSTQKEISGSLEK